MLEPFHLPYVQSGLLEIAILSLPAGILGSWIVLRGLAFYSHAVGTAAYPGLVLAGGLGFSAPLGALGAAAAFGAVTGALGRRGRLGNDALTALALAGFLAVGVILASDVFSSGADTDQLLFGSLFLIGRDEIAIAAPQRAGYGTEGRRGPERS
ncbi:MAG TPA: metal ABC transporter permease, partial [Solirubrobacterales bacterium]|nr:metal ABC transporter permease [Solirubrobacterales bacterium]